MAELKQVFLAAARRSAIGSLAGGLKTLSAPDIAAQVISTVVSSSGIPVDSVDQVILGCVLTAGLGRRQRAKRRSRPDCQFLSKH